MLVEGLGERLAGGYPLRQSGMRHPAHAVRGETPASHAFRLACPSSRTTRSGIKAVGFLSGAGAASSDAGTGAAAGVSVAAGAGGMCT